MKKRKAGKQPKKNNEVRYFSVLLENMRDDIRLIAEEQISIRKNIEIMKEDLEFIKQGLKRKVDLDEFTALERRVLLLEKQRG